MRNGGLHITGYVYVLGHSVSLFSYKQAGLGVKWTNNTVEQDNSASRAKRDYIGSGSLFNVLI